MSGISGECVDTEDCQVFVDGVKIIKQCYEEPPLIGNDNRTFFCDCPSWFGFEGEACDQVTPMVVYNRFMFTMFILLSAPLMIWITLRLCFFMRTEKFRQAFERTQSAVTKRQRKGDGTAQAVFIAVSCIIGLGLITFHGICFIIAMYHPENFGLVTRKFVFGDTLKQEIKAIPLGFSEEALILAFSFFLLASMQIAVSWLELTERITRAVKDENMIWVARRKKFKLISQGVGFFLVFFSLILLLVRYFLPVASICLFLSIMLLVLFRQGRAAIMKTIEKMPTNSDAAMQKAIRMIEISSKAHIYILSVMIFALLFHAANGSTIAYRTKPGNVNAAVWSRDLVALTGIALMGVDGWYINQIFDGLRGSSATGSRSKRKNDQLDTSFMNSNDEVSKSNIEANI